MKDHLEQQLVTHLRALIQPLNETYKDFYHIQLITLCDMKEMSCDGCKTSEFGQQCKRCVVGLTPLKNNDELPVGYEEISRAPE